MLVAISKTHQLIGQLKEKEAFAIISTINKAFLALQDNGIIIYCDNRNLTYLFEANVPRKPTLNRVTYERLERLRLYIVHIKYELIWFESEVNIWADLLTRWNYRSSSAVQTYDTSSFSNDYTSSNETINDNNSSNNNISTDKSTNNNKKINLNNNNNKNNNNNNDKKIIKNKISGTI